MILLPLHIPYYVFIGMPPLQFVEHRPIILPDSHGSLLNLWLYSHVFPFTIALLPITTKGDKISTRQLKTLSVLLWFTWTH